jgi:hypothetical protein
MRLLARLPIGLSSAPLVAAYTLRWPLGQLWRNGGRHMPRLFKDPVRHAVVTAAPPAPKGMKKRYDSDTRTVTYVPKTPNELLREGLRRKPR